MSPPLYAALTLRPCLRWGHRRARPSPVNGRAVSQPTCRDASGEMLGEEREQPSPRVGRGHLVVAARAVAHEAVAGVGVDDDLARMAGLAGRDLLGGG